MDGFWRALPDGVSVAVKVQPNARRSCLHGAVPSADGLRLRIAVAVPPENGRANRAACAVLAEALRVAPSAVHVASGAAVREKRLVVQGDPDMLCLRLAAL